MGQNLGNCIGNDVEIEFDSKQKMAWFSSSVSKGKFEFIFFISLFLPD